MRYWKSLVVFVLMLGLVIVCLPTQSMAQGASGVWISSIQVQNLGSSVATVNIAFYNSNGTDAGTGITGQTIDPGASKLFYLPGYVQIPNGFKGAAVVSADQPIAAIVNQVTTTSPAYNGSYSGASSGAPKVYLPAVVREYYGWNNELAIQNTSMTNSVGITIKFYREDGSYISGADKTDTIAAKGVGYYNIASAEYAVLGTKFNGSAVVSANDGTTGLVVVVNQTTSNGMMQSYTGFTTGYETVYVPDLLVGWYRWNSALKVQNVGTQSTTVTVTYSDGIVVTRELSAGAAYQFYQPTENHGTRWQGAATITTSGGDRRIVAIVSQATDAALAQAQTYEGFGVGGTKISLPVIMKNHYGWNTAFTVQNLGPGNATINITYNSDSYGFGGITFQDTINEGKSKLYYQPAAPQLGSVTKYNGSVTVEVVGGSQRIVAIVNQVCDGQLAARVAGDWAMSYSGILP